MRGDRTRTLVKSADSSSSDTSKQVMRKAPGPYAIPDTPAREDEVSFE